MLLEHGGRIRDAARHYGIPESEWMDLSTGVNPRFWPIPPGTVTPGHWHRLPMDNDGLEVTARDYYGSVHDPVVAAGSQAIIQLLPRLRPPGRVGIIAPTYAEHPHAWKTNGHTLIPLQPHMVEAALPDLDGLLVVNPNNPTGYRTSPDQLVHWRDSLVGHNGWLVVDEAFQDANPEDSVVPLAHAPGWIVLRSLGKFFGLAGARVGFVFAEPELLERIRTVLGPWNVSGPGRAVAQAALRDHLWQTETRVWLRHQSQRLAAILTEAGFPPAGETCFYQWVPYSRAADVQEILAHKGIWVRRFTDPPALRFGLPGTPDDWKRLIQALTTLR
jgi:cobalamin biosynthetic protein CobC